MKEVSKYKLLLQNIMDKYKPVAVRGQVLYFIIQDLQWINVMYQWSITYFMNIYNQQIRQSKKNAKEEERI